MRMHMNSRTFRGYNQSIEDNHRVTKTDFFLNFEFHLTRLWLCVYWQGN